jgi:hypothetical protein
METHAVGIAHSNWLLTLQIQKMSSTVHKQFFKNPVISFDHQNSLLKRVIFEKDQKVVTRGLEPIVSEGSPLVLGLLGKHPLWGTKYIAFLNYQVICFGMQL